MAKRPNTPIQGTRPDGGTMSTPDASSDKNVTDRIRSRAYEIWESEGSPDDRHDEHWLQAEREILHGHDQLDSDDVPNLDALREAARQHRDVFIVKSDLEDADEREATPGVREQP
ncbi:MULTISPECIES: DUF2934 domain-containing protein [unclassified Rhizobium]|uniref:DUF2934 domain-containing protein n=1 Tax=unclassified Rhizobium TaxID=2613769 RepID=UPI0016086539|nr:MULTISPECIES: DUF2934 domain-containing protein [unclassified Rhizobium]MBB3320486.1 hypothetical protein [Rhizobium sp. BK181]MBB3545433.1 hypothetical protein [Rhizobium sp. BK399]MCS4096445.1 hypothetical protein [Rhizobium sp. BK176]